MSEIIKLNPGIEGAEVRDAAKWVKHITEDNINRMKIGRKGFLFSFINDTHTIAGKVFIPSSGELWKSEKEVGFNCERLFNAFSIFKRRDKTELYIKEQRLFLKNGALKWRYEMEEVEQAQKIEFDKIPTPSIRINIRDILPVKLINKGKRVSDKKGILGFKYGGGKATMFVADADGKDRIEIGEVVTEGEGEGIALYNLVLLEKLLKDAKSGFMRIGEDKPAKLNVYTGRKTKAILYLAPVFDSDLIEEIRGPPSPKEEERKEEPQEEQTQKEEEEEERKGWSPIEKEEDVKTLERVLKRWESILKKYPGNMEAKLGVKTVKEELERWKKEERARIDKAATDAAEQVEREKKEEVTVKEEGGISIGTRVFYTGDMANVEGWGTISKIINDEFGRRYDINMTDGRVWHSLHLVMFEKSVGQRFKLEEQVVKENLDMIQAQEKREQEKAKGFREAIYKSEIVSVCFFNYLEGTKDAIYRDAEGYEYQSNALNFDTLEIKKIKELKRIDKAATAAAEQVEREKKEEAFKEAEQTVKEWKDSFKGDEVREEVIKEGVSFLTVREANGAAFHNSKEVYEDMKAEAQIDRECMWVLHLVGGKVLKKELVAMGKGNAAYTTPREIFRRAIIEGTTKIIMVHNHPSGDPTPSNSDISTCENYVKAGELLGIGLLDFLVIGTQGYTSFADKGLGGF